MKIIKDNLKESYSTYDIQNMIEDGTLGETCFRMIENLQNVVVEVAKTDKLGTYCKKYYRSAPGILEIINQCTVLLENIKRKG